MPVAAEPAALRAQETGDPAANFVISLRDADIRALSEQVTEITGRSLVPDPTVPGIVTVISAQPPDVDGVWELYQSVLAVQVCSALPSGNLWRIVPQAAVKEDGGAVGGSAGRPPPTPWPRRWGCSWSSASRRSRQPATRWTPS